MKICLCLRPEEIVLNASIPDKDAVLQYAAELFQRKGTVSNAERLYRELKAREEVMSTGIGGGFGVPHAVSPEIEDVHVLLLRLEEPIDFQALDALPVDVVMVLVVPEGDREVHLRLLACIARLCKCTTFLEAVRRAANPDRLIQDVAELEEHMAFH